MKRDFTLIALFFLMPILTVAQDLNSPASMDPFIGTWEIDLRPTPESDAYYQSFEVKLIDENTFTGTFYGSAIKNGLINKNWDKIYFAFSTAD